ncbi:MarR family transcriptional regulator [Notoacmeibacter ruber]|uniref:MarR family transcriptional regulator n=2 Tax=Notoacmeibacter ruber TaxID=2670375 RepID=A0A3L7JEI6_9HYPH|nr:MarR family transcriptional regulator [Notoacmeibacter ruber]
MTTLPVPMTPEKPLGLCLMDAQQWIGKYILEWMHRNGHDLNAADIAFLANLDCGETHASELARRMGITRQAVYRTTKGLSERGLLDLVDDPERRNQKIVAMTDYGLEVVGVARAGLEAAERDLEDRIGNHNVVALKAALSQDWGPPASRT